MSSRYTSAFDDLLAKNRRELDALYEGTDPSRAGRPSSGSARREPAPTTSAPTRAAEGTPGESIRPVSAETPAAGPSPAASPTERLLDERYGDGWRFEVTSRRRERGEVIVVGSLRLPGAGGVRTQFGSARIVAGGGTAGSAGGIAFSFGGTGGESPLAAEEAAFERAREDALANCAALL